MKFVDLTLGNFAFYISKGINSTVVMIKMRKKLYKSIKKISTQATSCPSTPLSSVTTGDSTWFRLLFSVPPLARNEYLMRKSGTFPAAIHAECLFFNTSKIDAVWWLAGCCGGQLAYVCLKEVSQVFIRHSFIQSFIGSLLYWSRSQLWKGECQGTPWTSHRLNIRMTDNHSHWHSDKL